MKLRVLLAGSMLVAAALPAQSASAAQRGRSVMVYAGVPSGSQELVTFACGGAAVGVFQSVRCSVSPIGSTVVGPTGTYGSVLVPPPSFTVTLSQSVVGTDGVRYSCVRSVTVTFTAAQPVAGTVQCIV